jgi:hypothetical protein
MHLTITKIHTGQLTNIVKKLLLMDSAVYLNLTGDRLYSNSFIPSKDVAKITQVPTSEVFEFENNEVPLIKMSFFAGQKLIDCLKYFDPHNLKGELHYYQDGEEFFAEKLVIMDHSLEITLHCADISLGFTTMSDTQIGAAFGNDGEVYNFHLSQELLNKLNNLITLDKNELFKIYSDEAGVHIAGDTYDLVVDDTVESHHPEINLFKSFFSRIDKESYAISVCQNKLVMDSSDSSTKIALNLAIKA